MMPSPFRRFLVTLVALSSAFSLFGQSATTTRKQPKQHTIIFQQWNLPYKDGAPPFRVEFDGKFLPDDTRALQFLDDTKFEAGSSVKVVLPVTKMPGQNFFPETFFIQHAMDDGAEVVFYQGEKKAHFHTLSFQNIRGGPVSEAKGLRGEFNTDTATYILDGRKFYDGPSCAVELKKLRFEDADKVVLVLFPRRMAPINFAMVDKSEIDRCVESMMQSGVNFVSVGGIGGWDGWPVPFISK